MGGREGKEVYQPSKEEIQAAEDRMTSSERRMSDEQKKEYDFGVQSRAMFADTDRDTIRMPYEYADRCDFYPPGEIPGDDYYEKYLAIEQERAINKEKEVEKFKQRVVEANESGDPRPHVVAVFEDVINLMESESLDDDTAIMKSFLNKLKNFLNFAMNHEGYIYPVDFPVLAHELDIRGRFPDGGKGLSKGETITLSEDGWKIFCEQVGVSNTVMEAKENMPKENKNSRVKIDAISYSPSGKIPGLILETRCLKIENDPHEATTVFSGATNLIFHTQVFFSRDFLFRLKFFDSDAEEEANKQAAMRIFDPSYKLNDTHDGAKRPYDF